MAIRPMQDVGGDVRFNWAHNRGHIAVGAQPFGTVRLAYSFGEGFANGGNLRITHHPCRPYCGTKLVRFSVQK